MLVGKGVTSICVAALHSLGHKRTQEHVDPPQASLWTMRFLEAKIAEVAPTPASTQLHTHAAANPDYMYPLGPRLSCTRKMLDGKRPSTLEE